MLLLNRYVPVLRLLQKSSSGTKGGATRGVAASTTMCQHLLTARVMLLEADDVLKLRPLQESGARGGAGQRQGLPHIEVHPPTCVNTYYV